MTFSQGMPSLCTETMIKDGKENELLKIMRMNHPLRQRYYSLVTADLSHKFSSAKAKTFRQCVRKGA